MSLLRMTEMAARALSAPASLVAVCPWCLLEQGLPHPERATDVTCSRHVPDMRQAWGLPRIPAERVA